MLINPTNGIQNGSCQLSLPMATVNIFLDLPIKPEILWIWSSPGVMMILFRILIYIPSGTQIIILLCVLFGVRNHNPLKVSQTSRDFRKLDQRKFCDLLEDRFREIPKDCDDPDKLCDMFESITSSILDELCPTTTKERIVKARLPWYNDNIHQERRVRRQLERKWRKTRDEDDYSALLVQKDRVNKLIVEAKQGFFTDKFLSSNTKEMFKTLNGLLNTSAKTLPIANSDVDLANNFLAFFVEKVENIRSKITADTGYEQETGECDTAMPCFKQLSNSDVAKIIGNLSSKSCSLDTLPSWLIKQNLECLLPIISRIVNSSLLSGVFPETLKTFDHYTDNQKGDNGSKLYS